MMKQDSDARGGGVTAALLLRYAPWVAPPVVAVLWAVAGIVVPWLLYSKQGDRGTFGDQFGAANSVLTGLTLMALAYSILLQKTQLAAAEAQHVADTQIAHQQAELAQRQLVLPVLTRFIEHTATASALQTRTQFVALAAALRPLTNGAVRMAVLVDHSMHFYTNPAHMEYLRPYAEVRVLARMGLLNLPDLRALITEEDVAVLVQACEPVVLQVEQQYDDSIFRWAESLYPNARSLALRPLTE